MQDFLAGCTLLASLTIFGLALIAVFKPLPRLWMGTRKRAFGGIGVAFGLFVLTAIIIPAPKEQQGTSSKVVAANGKGASPTASPSADEAALSEQRAAAIGFYKSIFGALASCDAAASKTAKVVGNMQSGAASVYDGYSAATEQVAACRDSWADATDVSIPDALSAAAAEKAESAKEACSNTALAKQLAAETAQEVFDGNTKPSKMQEMKERASAAQAGVMACAAGAMGVALESGVDLKALPKLD